MHKENTLSSSPYLVSHTSINQCVVNDRSAMVMHSWDIIIRYAASLTIYSYQLNAMQYILLQLLMLIMALTLRVTIDNWILFTNILV